MLKMKAKSMYTIEHINTRLAKLRENKDEKIVAMGDAARREEIAYLERLKLKKFPPAAAA